MQLEYYQINVIVINVAHLQSGYINQYEVNALDICITH